MCDICDVHAQLQPLASRQGAYRQGVVIKNSIKDIQILEENIVEKDNYIRELEKSIKAAKKRNETQVHKHNTEENIQKDKRGKELKKECEELEKKFNETKRKINRLEMLNEQLSKKLKLKIQNGQEIREDVEKLSEKVVLSEFNGPFVGVLFMSGETALGTC